MSIIRIVEGEMTNITTGVMNLKATEENFEVFATNKNSWHGKESGIYEKDYEAPHPEDSLNDEIDVTLNIFFDGTQNNKTNTQKGKNYKESNHKDDSYTNDFSNVARGYDATNPNAPFQKSMYIEGIATEDKESDDVFPDVALGMGDRGVVAKVVKACIKAPEKLAEYNRKQIDVLTINVFGFSRGAAAARHFLHIANSPAIVDGITLDDMIAVVAPEKYQGMNKDDFFLKVPNHPLLEKHGFLAACLLKNRFKIKKIDFHFVGLYDTVASYGVYHGNDVEQLKLNAIKNTRFVLQLSSDDEYRENFDLTNIKSAGLHGLELTLPGVHSDIGGSYVNQATEVSALYYEKESTYSMMTNYTENQIEKFKEIVVWEGWYKKQQLKSGTYYGTDLKIRAHKSAQGDAYYALMGTRVLYNTYEQIPLNLMFHYSNYSKNNGGVKYDGNLKKKHLIEDEFIQSVNNSINRYVNACGALRDSYVVAYNQQHSDRTAIDNDYISKLKQLSYLDYIDFEMLKKLRNEYLHWSVKANEIGLGSRESQAPTKEGAYEGKYRKREIHEG